MPLKTAARWTQLFSAEGTVLETAVSELDEMEEEEEAPDDDWDEEEADG